MVLLLILVWRYWWKFGYVVVCWKGVVGCLGYRLVSWLVLEFCWFVYWWWLFYWFWFCWFWLLFWVGCRWDIEFLNWVLVGYFCCLLVVLVFWCFWWFGCDDFWLCYGCWNVWVGCFEMLVWCFLGFYC